MTRAFVLFAWLIPGSSFAQSGTMQSTPPGRGHAPACSALPSTIEADTLGEVSDDGAGFYRVDGAAPGPNVVGARGSAAPTLEFELTGASRVRRGEPLNLALGVTNRSRSGAVVMRAMDGSAEHMRSPSYNLYIREVGSSVVYRWDYHGGRCGMTNAVTAEDYVRVAPGATDRTLPGEWGGHLQTATVSEPGQYEAWVVYRLCDDIGNVGPSATPTPPGPTPTPGEYSSGAIRFRVR